MKAAAVLALALCLATAQAMPLLRAGFNTTAPQCSCCGGQNCQILRCDQSGGNIDAAMSFTLGLDFTCNGKQLNEVIQSIIPANNWLDVTGNNNLGKRRVEECTANGVVLKSGSTITVQVAPSTALSGTGTYTLYTAPSDSKSTAVGCGSGSF